jgi:hypothetical protein
MDATSDHPTLTARALAAFVVSLALTGAYFALMFIVGLNRDSDIVRFHGAGVIGALTQGMSAVMISAPLFAGISLGVYLPIAAGLRRTWTPSRTAAMIAGALLCLPAMVVLAVGSWVIFDFDRPLRDVLSNMARFPLNMTFLMVNFAIGGAIVASGLGHKLPRRAVWSHQD